MRIDRFVFEHIKLLDSSAKLAHAQKPPLSAINSEILDTEKVLQTPNSFRRDNCDFAEAIDLPNITQQDTKHADNIIKERDYIENWRNKASEKRKIHSYLNSQPEWASMNLNEALHVISIGVLQNGNNLKLHPLNINNRRGLGLVSEITIQCGICDKLFTLHTEDPAKKKSQINIGFTWGTINAGSTYTQATEILTALDIPSMPVKMFRNIENNLDSVWQETLLQSMNEAGREELTLAQQKFNAAVPGITVYVDSGWSKRSYGHNYNAASGVVTTEQQKELACTSVGQFNNNLYVMERKRRLTASNFGSVVKRKDSTPCHNLVKNLLSKRFVETPALRFGKVKEAVAISLFEKQMNMKVLPAGLFVDTEYGFLAASPDGLIGENYLIEVKCLYSLNKTGETLEDAVQAKKNVCIELVNGKLQLKRSHNYFYQIQGQLHISKRQCCYFVIYVRDDLPLYIEEIVKDDVIWKTKMFPKLKSFYVNCLLPEIVTQSIKYGKKPIAYQLEHILKDM
ncbi:exonuclease phage-type/recb c-terminal domain-containing protein [Holotrichia oblita]|uniref:Exonuclease phage-type/recb c-terminal domain-containing protein n=1 Tax=Holotrichia oblita TaxID=644536 RepID=A0ACB9T8K4_HOLOL|nr:exonuclease phage-type/recb c-terminal domain-containing protein [Holotrichia oblita]